MALRADILLMGHERVGSLAPSRDKTTLIGRTLAGMLQSIATVFSRQAIPAPYNANGWETRAESNNGMSQLVPGEIESSDLKTISVCLGNVARVGVVTPDPELEAELRELPGLPDADYIKGPEQMLDPTGDPNTHPSGTRKGPDCDGGVDAPPSAAKTPGKPAKKLARNTLKQILRAAGRG